MIQFLSINFFSWISSIFWGFFQKFPFFLCHPVCAALHLSGCKHEKQSTTKLPSIQKSTFFFLQSSVQFQAVLHFPNHHSFSPSLSAGCVLGRQPFTQCCKADWRSPRCRTEEWFTQYHTHTFKQSQTTFSATDSVSFTRNYTKARW